MHRLAAPRPSGYSHFWLAVVLVSAAVPVRVYAELPLVSSFSALDVALLGAVVLMIARSAQQPFDVGDRTLFGLLCVPPAMSTLSLLWTQDLAATLSETLTYLEALVAYAFAVQQTQGVDPQRIVMWLRRFGYLMLVPTVLMLFHVPGFDPQEPGLSPRSGDYISYFSRLSHPFIGRSNNLATLLAMLVLVLFYWGVTRGDRASIRAATVFLVAIALTISRGVILALVVSSLIYLVRYGRRASRAMRAHRVAERTFLVAVVIGIAALGFFLLNPDTNEFVAGRLDAANLLLREGRFTDGLDKLGESPWLGFGAGTLPDMDPTIAGGVHNTYLQQLLAYGVVLGFVVIVSLFEVVRRFLPSTQPLRQIVGLTILAQLIIYATEASYEGALLRVEIYLLLGLLYGLVRAQEDAVELIDPPLEVSRSV